MKTTQLFLALAFLSLTLTNSAFGQTTITLNVDTDAIKAGGDIRENCWFDGQEKGENPETFETTGIGLGEVVTWEGIPEKGDDIIYIRRIKRKKGPNIFNATSIDAIRGQGNQEPQRVVKGIVYHPTEIRDNINLDYYYEISFTINEYRGRVTTYTIDPLIRTNVQTDIR